MERLTYIFDNAKVGIAICNAQNNTIEMLNKAFAHMHGYEINELIGVSPHTLFAPDCLNNLKKYANSLSSDNDITFETTHIRKDGTILPVSVHITLIKDESKTVVHRIINIIDISKRKEAENSLSKTSTQLSYVLNTIPDLIWLKNPEGLYLSCNHAFERFFDAPEIDIIGKSDYDFLESAEADTCRLSDIKALEKGEIVILEETIIYKRDNTQGILEIRKAPVYDSLGNLMGILGIGRDITERKKQEEQLKKTKAKLSAVISTIPDLIWVKDINGVYLMCNPAFERFFGTPAAEIIGKTDYDFIAKNQADFFVQKDREAMENGKMLINEEEIIFADNGEYALLETRKIPIYNDKEFMGVLGIGRNITENRASEKMLHMLKHSINASSESFFLINTEKADFFYVNDTAAKTLGYSVEELINGMSLFDIDPDFNDLNFWEEKVKKLEKFGSGTFETKHRSKEGQIYPVEVKSSFFIYENKSYILSTARDISDRKIADEKIEHMAHHDVLTGLPNRTYAKAKAEQIMVQAKRSKSKAAFFFIDLDGFKVVNDTFGHSIGDSMLKDASIRFNDCVRESDMISRQGGDEFLIVISDIRKNNVIATIADKILTALEKPFEIDSHTLSISGSIGIALYPDHGETFEALLQNADTAMYKAKELGKNGYRLYTQQMNQAMLGQFKLQSDLKKAIKNNEFVLYYQPQIDIEKNFICGAEALIRWNHPEYGIIPPMNFIPIAESSGLIVQIGQWVIEEACRQAMQWYKNGIPLTIAVNISAIQFKRGNLESIIKSALNETQLPPFLLELELTESVMMHNVESTLQTVQSLKALGIQLSIDDFGTGYSSLAYLKRFDVDKLKIDKSFIRDIIDDQEDAVIVQTIIQMAKNLNLTTIAEGVENQEVLNVINHYGCDEVQGYHFSKPLLPNDFETFYSNFTA